METPVREIQSSDGECFDEQVEKARLLARNARAQPMMQHRNQHQAVVGVSQIYQSGQDSDFQGAVQEGFTEEEYALEARLAAVMQAHLAYSQQAHNTIKSMCLEVIRQRETTIAQLQHENQRLQHQQSFHSFNSAGHNSGGTGESPPMQGYSSLIKKPQVAWNSEEGSKDLRDAARTAREAKIAAFPDAYGGVLAPTSASNMVEFPPGSAPAMLPAKAAELSMPMSSMTVSGANVAVQAKAAESSMSTTSLGVDRRPSLLSTRTRDAEDNRPQSSSQSQRRQSFMKAATKARLDAKERSASDEDTKKQDGPVHGAVFIDAAAMKERVREAVMRPEYNVMNFYKTSGCWQMIARHPWFENITLSIIAFNALWIAVDTDKNKEPTLISAHPVFIVAENTFCLYFSGELLIRFCAFRNKKDCMRDAWFMFDSSLVLMMVLETWVMSAVLLITNTGGRASLGDASILRLVRLLRLTRMARMARLLRAMPELMILIKGISVATRSVFFTLCLLAIIIYIFGVAFAQLSEATPLEDEYFGSVPDAMNALLLRGVLPDQFEFVNGVGQENVGFAMLLLFFILLSSLTVMNMLVGVLVEVVSVVSSVEKEQMTVQFVKTMIQSMLENSGIDADQDKHISRPEFESLLLKPEAARIIQEVGVDVVGLVDFADFIFKDGIELTFPEFMEIVLQLRGCNTATVRDIVDLRKFVLTEIHSAVSSISMNLSEKVEETMMIVAHTTANVVKGTVSNNQIANGAPATIQEVTLADTASSSKGFSKANARARGVNRNVMGSKDPNAPGDRVANFNGANNRGLHVQHRPESGVSGVSNPQPLPAFPDSMWITELENDGIPTQTLQEATATAPRRRVGPVNKL